MQIKTIKHDYTSTQMAKIKNIDKNKAWQYNVRHLNLEIGEKDTKLEHH